MSTPTQTETPGRDVTLRKIEEVVIRHRMEEAGLLADMTARVLKDVSALAGPANGLGSAVDQRHVEAMTLAQTIRRNNREYLRPQVDITEKVDDAHAKAVADAKAKEGEAQDGET